MADLEAIIKRKIAKSEGVQAALEARAQAVLEYWRSIAPVFGDKPAHRDSPSHGSPGDYRDSITSRMIARTGGDDGAFPAIRVADSDFKAKWIEYGSSKMPEYAPRAKTVERFRK